ncbi:MAG: hypothetical protein SGPRY_003606 [Prymnesium sp.]
MQILQHSLQQRYDQIAAARPRQREAYEAWVESGVDGPGLIARAAAMGLDLDLHGGQVSYAQGFEEKLVPLCFSFLYCRHGKTTGNTEPRVYQGFVDEPQNALNQIGLDQAEEAADKLDALQLDPDLIVLSPLSRAAETGLAYVRRHPELEERVEYWDDAAEMRFGAWDNVMVKDLDEESIGHLFYLDQNTVVKTKEPYVRPSDGKAFESENFIDTLERMHGVLRRLNEQMAPKAAQSDKPPLVIMYGHSMAGAALSILTGNGKQVDDQSYLGFDGKYIMPNATPVYLHQK